MQTIIRIGKRTFTVEAAGTGYILKGARGAVYSTVPFTKQPERFYLISLGRGMPRVDPLGPVRLMVQDGSLVWFGAADC